MLTTVGEFDPKSGYMLAGVPDGMGIYLLTKDVIRFVFQSESYGSIAGGFFGSGDSHPFIVNNNGAQPGLR